MRPFLLLLVAMLAACGGTGGGALVQLAGLAARGAVEVATAPDRSAPASSAGVPTGPCVTEYGCAGDDDCIAGQRCNRQLKPARCQRVACGGEGTFCGDDDSLCEPSHYCSARTCTSRGT